MATGMHALSPVQRETALCARGPRDLTPLAQACDAGDVRAVSELLSLGAARSIFVQGFRAQELHCTLPYSPVVPERHASAVGRALAEQRREVCENSQALVAAGDVKAVVDAALADYITQLAAGAVEFAAGIETAGGARDDDASSASTVSASPSPAKSQAPSTTDAADEMRKGDLVRLKMGLEGSSIMVSRLNADNSVASRACLGAAKLRRLGVVVSAASDSNDAEIIWVACVSSGHVCEYRRSDLVFADGSALDALRPEPAAPKPASKDWEKGEGAPPVGTTVTATSGTQGGPPGQTTLSFSAGENLTITKVQQHNGKWYARDSRWGFWFPLSSTDWEKPSTAREQKSTKIGVGSKVKLTSDYKQYGDASSGPLKRGEIGQVVTDDNSSTPFKVKAPNGCEWWYKAKAIKLVKETVAPLEPKRVPFKVDDIVTLAPGAFAARPPVDDANSSDDEGPADANGGCCVVTKLNFKGAAKVVRGPDWKWDMQDGAAGNTGILAKSLDSDGWASVRWEKSGQSNKYRVKSAQDLLYHTSDCVCGKAGKVPAAHSISQSADSISMSDHPHVLTYRPSYRDIGQHHCDVCEKDIEHDGYRCSSGCDFDVCMKCAAAAQPSSTPSPGAPAAAEWMPAAGELLAVCSIFHTMSTRGILVCSLTDARRLWVASASDLAPARAGRCSHVYRAGDLVQLDGGVKGACEGKCLGAPGEGRVGCVISAGVVRKGVQRNIEVAYVDECAADGEDGGDSKGDSKGTVAVSLYSAGDLLPASPVRYTSASKVTADERQGLIECLEALSLTTKTPLVPARLVEKFGPDVFSRLWVLFSDTKEGYWAVLKAFQTWHLRRVAHVAAHAPVLDAITELISYREAYKCQSAMESALHACGLCAGEEVEAAGAKTWTCNSCCIVNPSDRARCRVCDEDIPTWKCVYCVQVNPCTCLSCRHCHTPVVGSAGKTGQARTVAASVAPGNDGAGSPAQAQALLGGRSVVFLGESPETMLVSAVNCARPACKQTCSKCQQKFGSRNQFFKHLASTPCGRAPSPAAESPAAEPPDHNPSMYYGCRVQVKSTCALNGECGRILCVSRYPPAASAPNIWHDAMGRLVVEDGVGRMRVLGAWNADTGRDADTATPAPAFMNNMAPSSALTTSGMTCMCEFRVDGKLSVLPVEARNLSWLPGKPSNLPLPDQTSDFQGQADGSDAIAGQESNAGQGETESPWQVGALVRLLDTSSSRSSDLAPGRGSRSIGCISSVDLEHNRVSVCVFADMESCVSDCGDVTIGAEVRLAIGYATVQDASKGPLVAGQTGSVKALRDGLVLVESVGQAPRPCDSSDAARGPGELTMFTVQGSGWDGIDGVYEVDMAAGLRDGVRCYRHTTKKEYTITRKDGVWWIDYHHGGSPYHFVRSAADTPPGDGWCSDTPCQNTQKTAPKVTAMVNAAAVEKTAAQKVASDKVRTSPATAAEVRTYFGAQGREAVESRGFEFSEGRLIFPSGHIEVASSTVLSASSGASTDTVRFRVTGNSSFDFGLIPADSPVDNKYLHEKGEYGFNSCGTGGGVLPRLACDDKPVELHVDLKAQVLRVRVFEDESWSSVAEEQTQTIRKDGRWRITLGGWSGTTYKLWLRSETVAEKASRPSVGSKVRLTVDYKDYENVEDWATLDVFDALPWEGPLKPGDTGILKGDDKSDVPFQVEAPDGTLWHYKEGAIEEIPAEPLAAEKAALASKTHWWYAPEALVLTSTSGPVPTSGPVQTQQTVCCDSIGSAGSSNHGVFFNVVNTSSDPILITEIEAGAYGSSKDASLFACKHGACAGHETDSSAWRTIWKGTLNKKSATPCIPTAKVRLAPGEVQGFLLHSDRDGVLYSSSDKEFKDANVSVQPWYATSSSSPHGAHQSSKYAPAGKVSYVVARNEIVTMNLTDLQLVLHGNAHDLPAVEVKEFIASAVRQADNLPAPPSLLRPDSSGRSNLPPAGSAAKEDGGSKEQARMGASDVPPYPEDEAIVNDTLFNAERMGQTEAKKPEATPQCGSAAKLMREDSSPFYENCDVYKVISNFQDFISWRDRGGNTVAHHLAMADMPRSLKALYAENKESRWLENDVLQTPQIVSDGVHTMTPRQAVLHRALYDGSLLQTGSAPVPAVLIRAALGWPEEEEKDGDEMAPDVRKMETALANGRPDEVLVLACQASHMAEGRLYSALAMLELKYSPKQIQLEIRQYLEAVLEEGGLVSPLLYYIRFRVFQQQALKSAQGRQQAACAVAALRCFPAFAARWLRDHDAVMLQQLVDRRRDVDSGDEEDVAEDVEECGTAAEWRVAKADHQLKSKSMDELMGLTGLRQIKRQAMGIVKEVLLQRDRPAKVKAQTSMNFLFTGNPGCGKTTVARLLANCLSELGFRTKGIVETSAQDILKLKDPAGDFQTMFESAKGGTLFIDEAYRFSPAGASQQPNASNQVLDFLLEAVEKQEIRDTTTVILAGYGDEIEDLLSYNVGFASRFPLEFRFEDYDHKQLRAILHTMVKARGMQLQRKSVCGVAISDVVARRIHQGAGRKGFGNARAVRNKLEQIVSSQSQRIGTLKLRKQPVSEKDYSIITALDAIGARPNFACCAPVRDLNAMAGLNTVKAEFRKLLLMAQQNYDREMKGDAPESISLHRVFYGNPGTGKSTVARLYGALLKELGLLSKGDFIAVTPADLTGDAEGGAAANTKAVLERAKGKVLLIDEAYILDPRRKNNQYGGNVLDTLVEKLDGEAGADIAVILAGYKQEMFDMLDNNPGLRRRFNIDDFGMHFQDMSDEELKQVLVAMASNCGLVFENLHLVDAVVALVAQKRRMPGFGNAGTVGSMLNFAKASKAARLDQAQQAADEARRQCAEVPTLPDPDVLVRSDFIPQEVDVEQARDAFASLYNVEQIMQLMDNFEAIIMAATADGLEPADILADAHMVFVGPPGTGKTTVANRFGKLFKDLKVLPSDTVTCVTGTSLMGQYVGETKEKVLRAMNQARGGILFIDEAYGLSGSSTGSSSFGREAIDTLVGNITQAEFKGNLLVIMAGYEHCMDALFANANPGFASRFNKKRVVFEPWTAQQAGDAVISEIARCNKTVTPEAEAAVHHWCRLLEPLPSWGSARDVFDAILPALYTERASRLRAASKHASPGAISTSSAYQAEDVNAALAPITMSRRKLALAESKPDCYTPTLRTATSGGCGRAGDNGFPGADAGAETCQTNPKHKVKHKIRRIDNHDEDAEDEAPEPDVWAALEQACQELGYDIEYIAQFLEEGEYPQELLDKIVSITACNDVGKIRSMLDKQKGALQKRLELLIEHRRKEKSEEEARCQQKLQKMGRCPMDFEWLKEEGGWRCAGGSHYVSDADVSQFDA